MLCNYLLETMILLMIVEIIIIEDNYRGYHTQILKLHENCAYQRNEKLPQLYKGGILTNLYVTENQVT